MWTPAVKLAKMVLAILVVTEIDAFMLWWGKSYCSSGDERKEMYFVNGN